MNATRVRHLENALIHFDHLSSSSHQPLDLFLRQYFAAHVRAPPALPAHGDGRGGRRINLNDADKAWVTAHMYEILRWKGLLDYVSPPPNTWPNRLRTYASSDRWRSHTLNSSLPSHVRCSFPESLFRRMETSFGTKKAMDICFVLNESHHTYLRVNPLRCSRDLLYKYLSNKEVAVEKCLYSHLGLRIVDHQRLLDLPEYKQGLLEMQNEASQLVALKVHCKPGEKVLDYCAGSGGKSLVYGTLMENKGKLYLHDIRPHMLAQAKIRMKRAGIRNFHLLHPTDRLHPFLKQKMDWVVVDVPSSCTGALRRNPDRKWNYTDKELYDLIDIQRDIFQKALEYMNPEGKIMYSTCSVLDEENVQQVTYFCEKHGLCLSYPPFHALPQSKGMDGFFCAVFEVASNRQLL